MSTESSAHRHPPQQRNRSEPLTSCIVERLLNSSNRTGFCFSLPLFAMVQIMNKAPPPQTATHKQSSLFDTEFQFCCLCRAAAVCSDSAAAAESRQANVANPAGQEIKLRFGCVFSCNCSCLSLSKAKASLTPLWNPIAICWGFCVDRSSSFRRRALHLNLSLSWPTLTTPPPWKFLQLQPLSSRPPPRKWLSSRR
jgi:hypothetical protein